MGPRTRLAYLEPNRSESSATPLVFHVARSTPCPYLPGRSERKLLTDLRQDEASDVYSRLSRAGFRRSHSFAYRPACTQCSACIPIRVVAKSFQPSRSQRRTLRLNRDLTVHETPARATKEQYSLFDRYIGWRHGDGEMAAMSFFEYGGMVGGSPVDTHLAEFRNDKGVLVAACLTDWLADGPSAVYSFFEPALAQRSLGTYMILWLIEEARRRGLDYVYLGYWIAQARKMAYKARFHPVEGLTPIGWVALDA